MPCRLTASGAASVADLAGAPSESVHLSLWRCVLAARTRDVSFAPQLVLLANDPKANWQLRRAAINAAGFLPFEAALSQMLPILREASPLTIDDQQSLHTHSTLSWLLLEAAPGLLPAFVGGEARFVALVTGILEDAQADLIDPRGIAPGTEIAKWLYHRLLKRGWPASPGVLDDLINELHVPLLRSAVLRALRRTGRVELIEGELARADHVWIATKCLLECLKGASAGAAVRLAMLVARSPIAGEPRLTFILNRALEDEVAAKPTPVICQEVEPTPQRSTFRYEEAISSLTGVEPNAELNRRAPLVFEEMTFAQFEHLARLADPANDRDVAVERYVPQVTLDRESHTVAQWQRTYTSSSEVAGAWIRPALVAANRCDIPIRWHEKLLSEPYPHAYAERLLACLAAAGNAETFYRLLDRDGDSLLPHICSYPGRQQIAAFIDDRLIPFLNAHLSSGTDDIFAGLCGLARAIVSPFIDGVLTALFQRWTGSFARGGEAGPRRTSIELWRAFNDLTGHPRFHLIEDWQGLLSPVLQAPLRWHEKQKVLRVLERDSRSYIQIESVLFKSEDWEHFKESEVERLERAAERLFAKVAD